MLDDLSNSSKIKIVRPQAFSGAIPDTPTAREVNGSASAENLGTFDLDSREYESYNFSWEGKTEAILQKDLPPNSALEFHPEDSINYRNSQNLFVEGDNLEVLKIFQQSLQDKVKMIYIDPPYNARTSQSLYKDDFRQSRMKQSSDARLQVAKSAGILDFDKLHSRWLSMMYPRLFLARNLLTVDGVIFVSIDDVEVHNLRMIMNEIFGEENVETMIWKKVDSNEGKLKLVRRFRVEHEYVVVGYKDKEKTRFKKVDEIRHFKNSTSNVDDDPRGDWVSGNMSSTEEISLKGGKNYYQVFSPGGRKFHRRWKFPREEFERLNKDGRIYWGKQGNNVPRLKVFVKEAHSVYVSSLIEGKGTAKRASIEIRRLVGMDCFPNPKPVKLIQYLIDAVQTKNEIVMDFFAGSGTTAEAVLTQNAADGGNRSFILVQLPEPIDPVVNSIVAGKWKFKNSAEIARFRINAVIENLNRTTQTAKPKGDLGMKVLRLTN
jgi:adenine-specific DNA-methyltransferase